MLESNFKYTTPNIHKLFLFLHCTTCRLLFQSTLRNQLFCSFFMATNFLLLLSALSFRPLYVYFFPTIMILFQCNAETINFAIIPIQPHDYDGRYRQQGKQHN